MRRVLVLLLILLAVGAAVPAIVGSGSAPRWVKVSDDEYFAALIRGQEVFCIPAVSRLGPPLDLPADAQEPGVIVLEGGISLPMPAGPESIPAYVDNRTPFTFDLTGRGKQVGRWFQPVPEMGGWIVDLGDGPILLTNPADPSDVPLVSGSRKRYITSSAGLLEVVDLGGKASRLQGIPRAVIEGLCGCAWAPDESGLYLAADTSMGIEIWFSPLSEPPRSIVTLPKPFDGFIGTTPNGVLVHRLGEGLYEGDPYILQSRAESRLGGRPLCDLARRPLPALGRQQGVRYVARDGNHVRRPGT